ncbi:hypothetical protein, partial [Streptomyces sp. 1222.5]|uniref:hypothetical protein n=1 Tax=Streptomyces sp. 1222.5 TaxID=1881026 RepID=UPI003EC03009
MKIGLGRMGTAPAVIALVTIALGGVAVAAPVLTNHSAGAVTNSAKSIPATADSTGKKDVK